MQIKENKSTPVNGNNSEPLLQQKIFSKGTGLSSDFKELLQKGRLSDEDLEQFRLDIIRAQKNKHYKVLIISILIFLILAILIFYLVS
ncbi:hypothetical protein [Gramella sp. KN1008]|uniref:hypothetical protein n=1 Tax=Gramella sp. KN1008 TaxID=2529298 RepID=UPI00103A5D7A|nr:hypothetical protein [Gramella sp. KN1008]TBW28985.1 hypothetical protein EZJ28_03630 [Gramella sp. KN1008]